jgi:hypothetical protein
MNDRNICIEHAKHKQQITCLEHKCSKLDSRIWAILILLIMNLSGIIGILATIHFR